MSGFSDWANSPDPIYHSHSSMLGEKVDVIKIHWGHRQAAQGCRGSGVNFEYLRGPLSDHSSLIIGAGSLFLVLFHCWTNVQYSRQ